MTVEWGSNAGVFKEISFRHELRKYVYVATRL